MNAVQIENAQQHVRTPLYVIRKHNVTVSFESAIHLADELNRTLFMGVAMRIAHVGSFVDQHVIENGAVAFTNLAQLLDELRHVLHVVTIDLRVLSNILRLVAVVG